MSMQVSRIRANFRNTCISQFSRPKTVYKDCFVSFLSLEGEDWEALPGHSLLKYPLKKETMGGNPVVLLYR